MSSTDPSPAAPMASAHALQDPAPAASPFAAMGATAGDHPASALPHTEPPPTGHQTEPLRLLLLSATAADAEVILRALQRARLPVRGMLSQHARRLPRLLLSHRCDLIIAWLNGEVSAAGVAAGYRALLATAGQAPATAKAPPAGMPQAISPVGAPEASPTGAADAGLPTEAPPTPPPEPPPLLAIIGPDQVATDLVTLMVAGPVTMIQAGDTAGLLGAVRRQLRLRELTVPSPLPSPPPSRAPTAPPPAEPPLPAASRVGDLASSAGIDAGVTAGSAATSASPVPTERLVARAALLRRIGQLLDPHQARVQSFALIYVVLTDAARELDLAEPPRGDAAMAAVLAQVRQAAPFGALCGQIADDAVAALIEDVDRVDRGSLRARLAAALAPPAGAAAGDAPTPAVGVVVAEPGEYAPDALVAAALSDALAQPGGARPATGVESASASASAFEPATGVGMLLDPAVARTQAPVGPLTGRGHKLVPDPGRDANSVEAKIERALDNNGLTVMYQPIISLMGDSQEQYSVLLRLEDINRMMLTATELLQPAARSGNLPAVDRWVIGRALSDLSRWRRAGHRVGFFISLSAETMADDDLLIFICDSLREHNARGGWLTFQAQEREVRADPERWRRVCDGLKKINCRVAINQFGHAPKPETLLTQMPPDFVKFAPEFAIGLAGDPAKQQRLAALVQLARGHGARTIVGGVEDARSLTILWGGRIDYVQGNFIEAPSLTLEPAVE